MISVIRPFFFEWRPSVHRLAFGLDIFLPGIRIRLGHEGPPCRVCRRRDSIISWQPENPGAAVCHECCNHPDYHYEPGERDWFCIECGIAAPYEWLANRCDDDCCVSLGSSREPAEPIGTPISQLSGRPGHPGFEAFKRISSSWGYD